MSKGILLTLGVVVLLTGCTKAPESSDRTSNPEVVVETLFRHNGCTIYRFDDGRKHYFARCETSTDTMASHSEGCGKNCVRAVDENIRTEYQ